MIAASERVCKITKSSVMYLNSVIIIHSHVRDEDILVLDGWKARMEDEPGVGKCRITH